MATIFAVWLVSGVHGLGPLDDHNLFKTLFQHLPFGVYIFPELGRFFPLTAQEYVVAAKIFHPSATLFYAINAAKLVPCAYLTYRCLTCFRLNVAVSCLLWSIVLFGLGIANTLYRLSAGEINELIVLLAMTWAIVVLDNDGPISETRHRWLAAFVVALAATLLLYKETSFLILIAFSFSESVRAMRTMKKHPSRFVVAMGILGLLYVIGYGLWRSGTHAVSYAQLHSIATSDLLRLYAGSDPFVLFVIFPLTVYRAGVVVASPARHRLYDSLLIAATAYAAAFFLLDLFSFYYLLPVYALGSVGLAGWISETRAVTWRRLSVMAAGLLFVNQFPVFLSDIDSLKVIANNHFAFVQRLADWIIHHPEAQPNGVRTIVLAGVSPGNDFEIIDGLRIYLENLGVSKNAFSIVGSEVSNNQGISSLYGVDGDRTHPVKTNDVLVFNPYRTVSVNPPDQQPSLSLLFDSARPFSIPRWTLLEWIGSFFSPTPASVLYERSRIFTGYAAYLVTRDAEAARPDVVVDPVYGLVSLSLPSPPMRGSSFPVTVTIENTGQTAWPANGALQTGAWVNLSYRWFDARGQQVLEGDRLALPESILPGDSVRRKMDIRVPPKSGTFRLVIGPVQEGIRWFGEDAGRWFVVSSDPG